MLLTNNFGFLILCVIGSITITAAQGICPDISPCSYDYCDEDCIYTTCTGKTFTEVKCNATMLEVKAAFRSLTTPIKMNKIDLYIQPSGDTIPADIFGESVISSSSIGYFYIIGDENFPTLTVDPDAFRSSTFLATWVFLEFLDVSQVDFQFLSSGTQIATLIFSSVSNLHQSLSTLPPIPTLKDFEILSSTGLNQQWQNGDVFLQSNGLKRFYAYDCDLDDVGVAQFLDWMIPNAAETLSYFAIFYNRISSIPRQLRSFRSLGGIEIYGNSEELIVQRNSFNGTINGYIDIFNSKVIRVEQNAYLGSYSSNNEVGLGGNLLTRFEEEIFKSMLQDMAVQSYRGLYVDRNPFDCYSDPCHLAWLLRDNRNLLKNFYNPPECADGTAFANLSPSLFQDCP